MSSINIDGGQVNFSFQQSSSNPIINKVMEYLHSQTPFVLHDGNRSGPVFIPSKLACVHCGEVLIHSGVQEFQYSLSFQVGLWDQVDALNVKELGYTKKKLLPYQFPASGNNP